MGEGFYFLGLGRFWTTNQLGFSEFCSGFLKVKRLNLLKDLLLGISGFISKLAEEKWR